MENGCLNTIRLFHHVTHCSEHFIAYDEGNLFVYLNVVHWCRTNDSLFYITLLYILVSRAKILI